jgi:iron complex transport system substrate-binding protein
MTMDKHASKPLLFVVMSLMLLLSACGNNHTTDNKDEKANEAEKKTVTYQADNGEIEVPENPERIVVLADSYVGYLLKLDIQPIAVPQLAMDNPYFEGMLEGVELVTSDALEKMIELEPDLIITLSSDENISQLEKIAPTVAFEWGKLDYLETLTAVGELVNKEDEASTWLAKWNKTVETNKERVQAAVGNRTVSIMESFSKGVYVFGANFARGGEVIYDALELKAPEKVQTDVIEGSGFAEISLEAVPDYAGDYIFFGKWAGEETENDKIENSSLWKGLPAVKEGNVFILDPRTSFFSDPISLEKTMDIVVESLTENS